MSSATGPTVRGPRELQATLAHGAICTAGFFTTCACHLGTPISDGGEELQGRFERGLEQLGVLHHVTAPESPWQNFRAERHGGWLKQRLAQELDSGQGIATNHDDLDELLAS